MALIILVALETSHHLLSQKPGVLVNSRRQRVNIGRFALHNVRNHFIVYKKPASKRKPTGGKMIEIKLRPMEKADWPEVADLIAVSTNNWYEKHGMAAIFPKASAATMLFCEVYEALDPGCCILATHPETGLIMGSCFYHPRETHVSLGIMNVHPNHFGASIAVRLLKFITDFAEQRHQPVRLVSSAMNLDSFSLYTRNGFVPQQAFQDMMLTVSDQGFPHMESGAERVREATLADVPQMADLEKSLCHIRREKDYRYFIENRQGIWQTLVYENAEGVLEGFLVSVSHPGSNMLGPGVMRTEDQAAALIIAHLQRNRGRSKIFLVPVSCHGLIKKLYGWGARNTEIHFSQVRGAYQTPKGVLMPTFMPETA